MKFNAWTNDDMRRGTYWIYFCGGFACSECGAYTTHETPHCPHCGAKMSECGDAETFENKKTAQ